MAEDSGAIETGENFQKIGEKVDSISVRTKTEILQKKITNRFPHVQFVPDKRESDPDDESIQLAQDLREIGNLQKVEDKSADILFLKKERWQKKVKEKQEKGEVVSFDGQDLTNLDLSELDLSGISFLETNFSGSKLTDIKLDRAKLILADFRETFLQRVTMDKSFAVSVKFNNSQIENSELLANFAYSDFSGATVKNSRLNPQGFMGVKTTDATLEDCQPENKIDTNPKPSDDRIQAFNNELNRERLPGEKEQDEELLRDVDQLLKEYKEYLADGLPEIDEETEELYKELVKIGKGERDLAEHWYKRVSERQQRGSSVVFDGRDLSNLDLSHMDLDGLSFIGSNFEGTDLTWSGVTGTNLSLANLRNASLHMVSVKGTFAIGADFTDADLSAGRMREGLFARSVFHRSKIEYTDFKRAVFLGADFTDASIDHTLFDGVINLDAFRSAALIHYANA